MNLKNIECFVFDMDGTVYLGNRVIDGAIELIEHLQKNRIKFFFFTNNSSKSPDEYVDKLTKMGFAGILVEHVVTSGSVLADYVLNNYKVPKIYLAGTPALHEQLEERGIVLAEIGDSDVSAAVMGFDTTLDYEKLDNICRLVAKGKDFLATNVDKVCPLPGGDFMPDCGSMCKLITHSTGVEPKFLGKPFAQTVECILNLSGKPREKIAMVGDRLYTDIATAKNGRIMGIAVLSGEITMSDIEDSDIDPDLIVDSVADILEEIRR